MSIFVPMKKLFYLIGLILFFAANTTAKNADFFGAREEVVAKGGTKLTNVFFKNVDKFVAPPSLGVASFATSS